MAENQQSTPVKDQANDAKPPMDNFDQPLTESVPEKPSVNMDKGGIALSASGPESGEVSGEDNRWLSGRKLVIVHSAMLLA